MKKIEVGKSYKTRDGSTVRIYAVDGIRDRAIHGAVFDKMGAWLSTTWPADGSYLQRHSHDWDIVTPPLKYEGEATVMGFGDGINSTIFVPSEFEGLKVKFTLEEKES